MGTIIQTGFVCSTPDSYVALFQKIWAQMHISKCELVLEYPHRLGSKLPQNLSDLTDQVELERLLSSNSCLRAFGGIGYPSGKTTWHDIQLFGDLFNSGYSMKRSGAMGTAVPYNDVSRKLRDIRAAVFHGLQEMDELDRLIKRREVLADYEDLFLQYTFGDSRHGNAAHPHPDHCCMYRESNPMQPACSSMVYHREPQEFGNDFLRIWYAQNCPKAFDENTVAIYKDSHLLESLKRGHIRPEVKPSKGIAWMWPEMVTPSQRAVLCEYVSGCGEQGLTLERAQSLAQTPSSVMCEALQIVCGDSILDHFYHFPGHGAALCTLPYDNILMEMYMELDFVLR